MICCGGHNKKIKNMTKLNKTIAILGPTAAGKTNLAIQLAKGHNGEIVCVDSRTVYRGLDIGTAKPTRKEQELVRHHLLDILDPEEMITAARFKELAERARIDIISRGRLPILVGGSGLYMDAILYDYKFPGEADMKRRAELDKLSLQGLKNKLRDLDPELYVQTDIDNKRRLIRAIEVSGQPRSMGRQVIKDCLCLGLTMSNEVARERIRLRLGKMLDDGLMKEVETIGERFGYDCPALQVTGYGPFKQVVFGNTTVSEALLDAENETMAVYKKQVTWFKRNKEIKWVTGTQEAEELVGEFLQAKV